jgi:hypothetical protein
MQTNAPAELGWVDQFNRAVAYGQVSASSLGAVPASVFVNPQSQVQVYVSSTTDLNLLAPVASRVEIYTVPTGYRLLCDQFAFMFTAVAGGSGMVGATQPSVRLVKNGLNTAANQISNEISLSDAGQVQQTINKYWRTGGAVGGTTSTSGKATAAAGEIISAQITGAFVAGTNPYTTLNAKCFMSAWLIPV